MNIITEFDPKPIPLRQFDWCAVREGYDGGSYYAGINDGDPIGWGRTELDAIAALFIEEEFRAS
jgi:hypothetical protein